MKCLTGVFLCLYLVVSWLVFAQEPPSPLEQYQQTQRNSLAQDKRFAARDAVLTSRDEDTQVQAFEDLLRFSSSDEQKLDALDAIETAIGNARADSRAFQQGTLTKGKLLKRLGRDDESYALFQDAIQNRWQHAMWRYSESLIDAGELAEASILEYERVIGKGDYAHFRAEKEDFFIFITLLRLMKSDNPEASAVEQVLPALEDSTAHPHAKNIAKALCLVQDQEYAEAIELLKQVDIELAKNPESNKNAVVDEYRNTPLYLTAALLFQGEDIETARESYGEFLTRNQGNWKHIYDKSMRIVRDLTFHDLFKKNIIVITTALFKSPIFTDDVIKKSFSDDDIAAVYDMHAYGLRKNGMFQEAFKIREQIIEDFFPHTLAGAMCALHNATYLRDMKDLDTSKALALRIVNECNYREAVPWAKHLLATIAAREKRWDDALELIEDALMFVGPEDKGEYAQGYRDMMGIKKYILSNIERN